MKTTSLWTWSYPCASVFDVLDPLIDGFMSQVPDTSRVAALNLAQKLQLPYREGFIKNRYVGRTFIMPGQQTRSETPLRLLYIAYYFIVFAQKKECETEVECHGFGIRWEERLDC